NRHSFPQERNGNDGVKCTDLGASQLVVRIGLGVRNMNRNSLKQRTSACTPASWLDGRPFQVFLEGRRKAVSRRLPKKAVAFRTGNIAEISLAQPCRRLDQRVEHGLQVEGRAADHLEHVGGRRLLLQRLAQLVEQARVLYGDDGLLSEVAQELDMLVAEWFDLLAGY